MCALSLLLCISTAVVWLFGYRYGRGVGTHSYIEAFPIKAAISLRRTAAVVTFRSYYASETTVRKAGWAPVPGDGVSIDASKWWFGYRCDDALLEPFNESTRPVMVEQTLQVPYWFPLLATGIGPFIYARRAYRRHRRPARGSAPSAAMTSAPARIAAPNAAPWPGRPGRSPNRHLLVTPTSPVRRKRAWIWAWIRIGTLLGQVVDAKTIIDPQFTNPGPCFTAEVCGNREILCGSVRSCAAAPAGQGEGGEAGKQQG